MLALKNKDFFNTFPDAILMDLDNTIYSYDLAHEAAIKAVVSKACKILLISSKQFESALDEAKSQIKSSLAFSASSHSRLLYFQRTFEILGLGSQILKALDFEQTYWRTFLSNAILFDEVKEFFDDARLHGIPICIVTDLTAQIQFRKLVYFELDQAIDFIVTSEEAGIEKPQIPPFQLALEKLKINKDNQNVWMIGDDLIKDIQGAKTAIGAITLHKFNQNIGKGLFNKYIDYQFRTFAELRILLKNCVKFSQIQTNECVGESVE